MLFSRIKYFGRKEIHCLETFYCCSISIHLLCINISFIMLVEIKCDCNYVQFIMYLQFSCIETWRSFALLTHTSTPETPLHSFIVNMYKMYYLACRMSALGQTKLQARALYENYFLDQFPLHQTNLSAVM